MMKDTDQKEKRKGFIDQIEIEMIDRIGKKEIETLKGLKKEKGLMNQTREINTEIKMTEIATLPHLLHITENLQGIRKINAKNLETETMIEIIMIEKAEITEIARISRKIGIEIIKIKRETGTTKIGIKRIGTGINKEIKAIQGIEKLGIEKIGTIKIIGNVRTQEIIEILHPKILRTIKKAGIKREIGQINTLLLVLLKKIKKNSEEIQRKIREMK